MASMAMRICDSEVFDIATGRVGPRHKNG